MELYTNDLSPFCRKVHVTLIETGLRDQVTDIAAVGHPVDSSQMPTGQNPIGKIPTLIRDDGPAMFDSRVICRFLDDRAGTRLYPEGNWDVLTLEAMGDAMNDAAVLMVYEGRTRPEDLHYAPWVEGQWAKIARSLDALEARWMSLLEGPLNIGQIAVSCALGYIDLRHPDRNWRDGHGSLADWEARFAERPSMKATVPVA